MGAFIDAGMVGELHSFGDACFRRYRCCGCRRSGRIKIRHGTTVSYRQATRSKEPVVRQQF